MVLEKKLTPGREAQFVALYKNVFPTVARFVKKMGGSLDEAKDVFHDALIIFYEKQDKPEFTLAYSENAYVAGIARYLWYNKYRQSKTTVPLDQSIGLFIENDEPKISERILNYVAVSGKKCLELLQAFYYDRLPMKEIAGSFGFSGERSATAQKYKCLEKVREAIREQSLKQEDFYE